MKTQATYSQLSNSNISKNKKAVLMRVLKRNNQNVSQQQMKKSETQRQQHQRNNNNKFTSLRSKTQRNQAIGPSAINQHNSRNKINSHHTRYKTQTQTTNNLVNNNKINHKFNIFQNPYVDCLKNGYTTAQSQTKEKKFIAMKKQQEQFYGPKYFSISGQKQIQQERLNNPQDEVYLNKEEVYKSNINPKYKKFKISLKRPVQNDQRNNDSPQQKQKLIYKKMSQSNKPSSKRILITQIKTQDSKLSFSDRLQNNSSLKSSSLKKIQNYNSLSSTLNQSTSLNQNSLISNKKIFATKNRSLKIPKLRQNTNLHQSIKIFQRKQTLLGKIQSSKQIYNKYGNKLFQSLLRNNYESDMKKYQFQQKIEYDEYKNEPKPKLKNPFIEKIQKGRFAINLKKNENSVPFKLIGSKKRFQYELENKRRQTQILNQQQTEK